MIPLLVSLLGGPEALAGRLLLKLVGGLSGIFAWARANPGWALAIVALLWGVYERHDAAHARALTIQWRSAYDVLSAARKIDQQSIADLKAAVAIQNEAVRRLKLEGEQRQQAAQAALEKAKRAAAGAEAQAARLDAAAASAGKSGCPTSKAVMTDKGDL